MACVDITFSSEELATEEWRDVVGYEGIYSVSNLGRIRRDLGGARTAKAGRVLKLSKSSNGYPGVALCAFGKQKTTSVHGMVARAFISKPPTGKHVNHKDGCKTNNRLTNLEYVTASENVQHAYRNGLAKGVTGDRHGSHTHPERVARGDRNGHVKIKDADIPRIFELRTNGLSQRKIALIVGLTQGHICEILNGKKRRRNSKTI
jgi:hypothetical protein